MCTKNSESGFTLIEVMATVAIISILAAGILPLSQMVYIRKQELELRRNLRVIRTALDEYNEMVKDGILPGQTRIGDPETLEVLGNGVYPKTAVGLKKKFLRRIPEDPMTEAGKWGLRSYADDPDSTIWGGEDVYDVYSTSDRKALDGTYYSTW